MIKQTHVVLAAMSCLLMLSACGGAGDFNSGSPNTPIGGGSGSAPSGVASIIFTQPIQGAIEDRQNGDYRIRGKVDVVDRDGRAVPDGTSIELILIDTVILQDSTGAVDAATLDVLRRSGPSLITVRCDSQFTVEATNCQPSTSNFTSTVVRNNSLRGLQPGDFVIMRNADVQDRFRRVLSVDGPDALRLDRPLARSYSGLEIWVGTAASGISAAGIDPATQALTQGRTTTIDGEAEIRVTYPANRARLRYGCFGYQADGAASSVDLRDSVPQSRQLLVAARAPNGVTAVDVGTFCAKSVAGGSVTADITSVTLDAPADGETTQQLVTLIFRDGGQGILLAYDSFNCVKTSGPASVSVFFPNGNRASVNGVGQMLLSRDSSDADNLFTRTASVRCLGSDFDGIAQDIQITLPPRA